MIIFDEFYRETDQAALCCSYKPFSSTVHSEIKITAVLFLFV